jgi:hypothetical protein
MSTKSLLLAVLLLGGIAFLPFAALAKEPTTPGALAAVAEHKVYEVHHHGKDGKKKVHHSTHKSREAAEEVKITLEEQGFKKVTIVVVIKE